MSQTAHHAALCLLAAITATLPAATSAVANPQQPIMLAQAPPSPEEGPVEAAPPPPPVQSEEPKKRRNPEPSAQTERSQQRDDQRAQREQEREQERARAQEERAQQQEQQRARAQQEAERVRQERDQEREQQRARAEQERAQQQEQDQQRAREQQERAQQEEQQRAKAQQETERVRQERDQEREQQRARAEQERAQQQEQQRAKAQQDSERVHEGQERVQQEEQQRAKARPDGNPVGQEPAPAREQKRQDARPSPDTPSPDTPSSDTPSQETVEQARPRPEVDRAGSRDGERRKNKRDDAPATAIPPTPAPVGDSQPAVQSPPAREVERTVPRDDERRRLERRENRPVANPTRPADNGLPEVQPPPPSTPAAGTQPAVQPPPVREDARRAVGRDTIRESYRRAPSRQRSFDDLRKNRRERTISQGNLRVIDEPDRRIIVKQNNRTFIRHDESERFRRIAPDARTIKRADGTSTTFMTRSSGVRIYDVSDRNGRLLLRYRRYPNGREVILIDNRRHYSRDKSRTRDVLIGAGIGLFIGSAIALAAPEIRIPRDEYIVDYGRASDEDLYDALTAPPIERLERGYSLDEIRYSAPLRDRMRRIDLDTVTFDFGSWEVGPDQGRALDRLADGINRVLQRNPDEIFMIEGHTDAVGSQDDNLTLSDRRAQSVAEILTTEYGVAPENLVTQGYGEEQLKIPTDGPERLNRRITVRRIGPLLSGQFEEERYSGARPADNRGDSRNRDYENLDDGPPDDGRTYDYENDRYQDRR